MDSTGYYWRGARYYDSESGQWLSFDPYGYFGGSNPYGYVNDPINFADPKGRLAARNTEPGNVNAPPPLEVGVAPLMQEQIYTDYFFSNGTHTGPVPQSQPTVMDADAVEAYKAWTVTEPTGRYFSYVRNTRAGGPLSKPDYGKKVWRAITKTETQQRQRIQFLKAAPMILLTVDGMGPLLEGAAGEGILAGLSEREAAALAAETTGAESALQYQQLKATLRLQEQLGTGNLVTRDALELGQTRVAVYDLQTGRIYVGNQGSGIHIAVLDQYGLPPGDNLLVGFIKVENNGRLGFDPTSGSFPLSTFNGTLDNVRGTGISIIGIGR